MTVDVSELRVRIRKSPHCCGLFELPASATTEAERYARTTITIAATAIVRPTISAAITTAIVRSRGVIAVAIAVVRTVIAIAVMAIVTTAGAKVGRLLRYVG